jgi:endonuclease/exonuclease/phosphatase (EEP) superfamily protein YafD
MGMGETVQTPATGDTVHCGRCGAPKPIHSSRDHCPGCGTAPDPALGHGKGTRPARPTAAAWIGPTAAVLTWLWALGVLLVLVLIRWVGDRWWGVTVLLFAPRWLFLAPLPVLALASGVARRPRHWIVQGAVALVVAGPLMLVSLPVHQLWDPPVDGFRVRIMTLNRSAAKLDVERLARLIEQERIDLICFQEEVQRKNRGLEAYLKAKGWYRDRGLYLASRYPIVAEMPRIFEEARSESRFPVLLIRVRIQAAPGVEFGLATVHMPTLRFGLYRFLDRDIEGLKEHAAWWDLQIERLVGGLGEIQEIPYLVGGDFNAPPDQSSMAGLGSFLRFGFEDAGWGYGYTRPARYPWFRIDHLLASPEWVFTRCWVGPDVGSDHLPLIAEAVLPAAATAPTPDPSH